MADNNICIDGNVYGQYKVEARGDGEWKREANAADGMEYILGEPEDQSLNTVHSKSQVCLLMHMCVNLCTYCV